MYRAKNVIERRCIWVAENGETVDTSNLFFEEDLDYMDWYTIRLLDYLLKNGNKTVQEIYGTIRKDIKNFGWEEDRLSKLISCFCYSDLIEEHAKEDLEDVVGKGYLPKEFIGFVVFRNGEPLDLGMDTEKEYKDNYEMLIKQRYGMKG